MPANASLFIKSLFQILTIIELMASPHGTSIEELTRHLSLTRRSIFRLIKTIEQTFHIPVIIKREMFGCPATYHLPESFLKMLSSINAQALPLSFSQAILFYLLFSGDFSDQKCNLSIFYKQWNNAIYSVVTHVLYTVYKLLYIWQAKVTKIYHFYEKHVKKSAFQAFHSLVLIYGLFFCHWWTGCLWLIHMPTLWSF